MNNAKLHNDLLNSHLFLDPHKEGDCWPDPVGFDGRPLGEQGRDIVVLLSAKLDTLSDCSLRSEAVKCKRFIGAIEQNLV